MMSSFDIPYVQFHQSMYNSSVPLGRGPAYSGPMRWGLFITGPLR